MYITYQVTSVAKVPNVPWLALLSPAGAGSTRTSVVTFAGETNFTHNYAVLDGGEKYVM